MFSTLCAAIKESGKLINESIKPIGINLSKRYKLKTKVNTCRTGYKKVANNVDLIIWV